MRIPPLLVLPLSLLLAAPALADTVEDVSAPAFPHLAPDGLRPELAGDVALVMLPDDASESFLLRLHLGGQIVNPKTHLGFYASAAMVSIDDYGDFQSTLGDLELGGLYHVGRRDLDTTFRVGLVLPTMSQDLDALSYAIGTIAADPSDLVTAMPGVTSVRLAASPTYHQGHTFARLDVGVDVPVSGDDMASSMVHADVGIGVTSRPVGGSVELQSLCLVGDDLEDRCAHLLAAELEISAGEHSAATVGVSRPLGVEGLDELFAFEVGFRARR